ncbi:MAG: Acyltransferase domain protein [Ignavibacteria bacterium]|nr:MAG: Acyltransferase domain protein [Ignavibacteria bacterium]KAF0155686.1 MAG: Acyltransferase domain protein [Ignavibacteria bacterium]
MIKADHNNIAQFLFYPYIKWLMKKHFAHFYLVNEPPKVIEDSSLLLTPNHISWWDGFFIGHLEKKYYNRKVHIMMLEEQLKNFWFFSKVGAYSIKQESIKSFLETRAYTRELISQSTNSVIVYPQGEIEDYEKRPLTIKKGIKNILQNINSDVTILPIGFKIQFHNEMKPVIAARFGMPMQSSLLTNNFSVFENEFHNNLELLSDAVQSKKFILDLFGKDTK